MDQDERCDDSLFLWRAMDAKYDDQKIREYLAKTYGWTSVELRRQDKVGIVLARQIEENKQ